MKDVKSRALPIRPASKTKNVRQASTSLQQGKRMIVAGFADSGSSQVFWLLKEIYTNGN
ncbi:BnaC09g13720D [Brassica napus]|uniref:BnaC09g13720D protein n=1 Tax=Brassica napus TaxID=3708 RepID=A0A078G2M4_BRANA|nr:BnaC09g13720D [Brassica napus]